MAIEEQNKRPLKLFALSSNRPLAEKKLRRQQVLS